MSSNVIAEFMSSAPLAEEGGAISADRFDYQKNWALARLLSLHQGDGNYVLLCELHEDIAVLDCSEEPTKAVFYQIKTSASGAWTLKKLTNRRKGKDGASLPSILGRLCAKASELKEQQVTFQFVTNVGSGFSFKAPLATKATESSGQRLFDALNSSEWNTLKQCLADELGQDLSIPLQDQLKVSIAQIHLGTHNETTVGLVANFLEEHVPGAHIQPKAFYRTLFDELRRRTVAKRPVGHISDVCKMKGIDRQAFDFMLASARSVAPAAGAWAQIQVELHHDGVSLALRRKLKEAYPAYFSRMQSPLDAAFRRDHRLLVAASESTMSEHQTLLELAEGAVKIARKDPGYGAAGMSAEQELIVVMMAFYETDTH
ncbi:DUF4297 domain-containing protein [Xanthomonas translucens]|uniref:CD-NTase associated protein 4-like DNA endonuclease domain-containing protein n=2 Tax=Xanthomonas campestris pv. translucens TaxID=343 RepID=A0A109HIT3_XANCT|nr:DUF4297 domain-containing protein [Xanthomonas translucens]KWV12929.1 hypothetical protein ATB53_04780 [Xanthomonas translucens]